MRIFILLAIAVISLSCVNTFSKSKNGDSYEYTYWSVFSKEKLIKDANEEIKELLEEGKKALSEEDFLHNRNDLAANYIKVGELNKAEVILQQLLQKFPNEYSLYANLGTLYELKGQNQKALDNIKYSVKLNPESHQGSEWFHISVLEFKLKFKDTDFSTSILHLDTVKTNPNDIFSDIDHQLNERIPFTPEPNLLMARILAEYGDFVAENKTLLDALEVYYAGMDYDVNNRLDFKKRMIDLMPYFSKYSVELPNIEDPSPFDKQLKHILDSINKKSTNNINSSANNSNMDTSKSSSRFRWLNIFLPIVLLFALYFITRKRK
jgi:tetratricopeptide (TPR) repeat protein